jgi:hypothetical protein
MGEKLKEYQIAHYGENIVVDSPRAKELARVVRTDLKDNGAKRVQVRVHRGQIVVTTDAANGQSLLSKLFQMVQGVTVKELDPILAIQLKSDIDEAAQQAVSQS